jgi:uncharacterized protein
LKVGFGLRVTGALWPSGMASGCARIAPNAPKQKQPDQLRTIATGQNRLAHPTRFSDAGSMNGYDFTLAGASLRALGTGALWWPGQGLLCVSDLHLGKSVRFAHLGGTALPPYDTRDTLTRLAADLARTQARIVVCLGDSFDGAVARSLPEEELLWISRLQAGRRWIWIAGTHDPGPVSMGGTHLAELPRPPMVFRHIAKAAASAEISGHYHPKARMNAGGRSIIRPAFLADRDRVILPSYGASAGSLPGHDGTLTALMRPEAIAILTGHNMQAVPMPR